MPDLEQRVAAIEDRNARVQIDKAWETSWVRRGSIAMITYLCSMILLVLLEHNGAYQHALIPVMGYVLSTLSLPFIKNWWGKHKA